jgi:Flp pilus assembly protein protease CpaA
VLAAHLLVIAWALGITLSDALRRRIPNLFSLGAIAGGLIYLISTGHAVLNANWLDVLLGLLLALLLTLPAYLMRWLGAGDVKLLLAIASLGGWKVVLSSFAVAGILGGISALAVMQYAAYFGYSPANKRWLPFGAMLAVGLIASMGFKW